LQNNKSDLSSQISTLQGQVISLNQKVTSLTPPATSTSTSTTPSTTSTTTYTNTAFKYQLQYPSSWSVSAIGNANVNTFGDPNFSSPCNYSAGDRCSQFFFGVQSETGANLTRGLSTLISDYFAPTITQSPESKIISNDTTTIGGIQWQKVVFYQNNQGNSSDASLNFVYTYLFAVHNNNLISVSYYEQQKGYIQTADSYEFNNIDQFNQIISTVRYTD
jgi:hypothetical protein